MPMPNPGAEWPSPMWQLAFAQYATNDARYTGDQQALQAAYARLGGQTGASRGDSDAYHFNTPGRRGGIMSRFAGFLYRFFNATPSQPDEARMRFLSPAAYNLANLSSDLLTAEPPVFRIVDENGKAVKSKAQDRVDKVLNGKATNRALAQAAELAAGLGAVVLTAKWDDGTNHDAPWMEFAACDAAIPEFIGGQLDAVNLFTLHYDFTSFGVLNAAYFHIERHEVGQIVHGLYKVQVGQTAYDQTGFGFKSLGELVPLTEVGSLAHIVNIPGSRPGPLDNTVVLPTGIKRLTASWWRNRPTKTFRKYADISMIGRADFEGEGEIILDAIDMVWSSWLRDIKLAKARLIIPESLLNTDDGAAFDGEREILQQLAFVPKPDQELITAQQFAIRAADHQQTLTALTRELTQFAGYSMSTYGDEAGASKTATEVVDRTTLTERTRDKKSLYLFEAADPIARALMDLDKVHYRGPGLAPTDELDISIPDLSQIDPEKEARTLQYLRAAQAISVRTSVDMQHPEWEQSEKDAEVQRILAETGMSEEPPVVDAGTVNRTNPDGTPIELQQVDPQQGGGQQAGDAATGNPPAGQQPAALTQGNR